MSDNQEGKSQTTAMRLKDSFLWTAVQELTDDLEERERLLVHRVVKAAMARAQTDLDKHLPAISHD